MASLKTRPPIKRIDRPTADRSAPFRFLRWRKALRDLNFDRQRTILVMLSLGIGVTVFGMIIITTLVIPKVANESYLGSQPASAGVFVSPIGRGFDLDLIEAVAELPAVEAAIGRREFTVRMQDVNGEWNDLVLVHASHLEEADGSPVDMVLNLSGEWPPAPRSLVLERNSRLYTGLALGDLVTVETPDGRLINMPIDQLAYDPSRPPSQVTGVAYAFVDRDTFEWLGLPADYNELRFTVAQHQTDEAHIALTADQVSDKMERGGWIVTEIFKPTPGQHPLNFLLDTVIVILRIVAVLALLLSMFLIINTLSAMLAQHSRQIAVMKAIGGHTRLIIGVYLRMVLMLGIGGLIFALPLAIIIGNLFSRFIAWQLNVEISGIQTPPTAIIAIVLAGLLVPLLATFIPIQNRAAITIREALDDRSGDAGGQIKGERGAAALLRRLFSAVQALFSRPVRLSMRNTFRRKARLALTLFTLMFGGAIFIGVMTLRTSLFTTLEATIINQGFDISIQTDRPLRTERLENIAHDVDGITHSEGWLVNPATIILPDGRDGARIEMRALPVETDFFIPDFEAGRWLQANSGPQVVLHRSIRTERPDTEVGDWITLKIMGEELEWQVVGITQELMPPLSPIIAYVNYDYFADEFGLVTKTNTLRLKTAQHDPAFIADIAKLAEVNLLDAGIQPKSITTIQLIRDILTERFNLITVVLTLLSTMIATVGGLGLMGTMSINVIERRREIGVMRSIGGTDRTLLKIFMIEGVIIGIISWLGASILGQPLSRALGFQIGNTLLQTPLQPVIAWWAIALWLMLVLIIALLSSYLPAKQATEISIRETLAYE